MTRHPAKTVKPVNDERKKMVGVARIELATPAMSTQCSTTELHAHPVGPIKHCLMGGPGKSSENQVSVGHLVRTF